MSQEAQIHDLDPRFYAAIAREPRLVDYWLGFEIGDLGLDAKKFAAHPDVKKLAGPEGLGKVRSTDDGVDLAWYLEAIVFVLRRAYPDEEAAWAAVMGTATSEFPVLQLGSATAIAPFVVRRIAGLINVRSSLERDRAVDFEALAAADVYPQMWSDADEQARFRKALSTFVYAIDRIAERGHGLLIAWTL